MLTESGTVIENQNEHSVVRVRRGEACGSCSVGCTCADDQSPQIMNVVAQNLIGAKVGDRVELALGTGTLLSLSAMTYLVPLLFLFAGALSGHRIAVAIGWSIDADLAAAAFGFAFLVVSFLGVALLLRRQKPGGAISPMIVKILPPIDVVLDPKFQ